MSAKAANTTFLAYCGTQSIYCPSAGPPISVSNLTLLNLPIFSTQALCVSWEGAVPSAGAGGPKAKVVTDFSTHQCCNNASFVSVFLGKSC